MCSSKPTLLKGSVAEQEDEVHGNHRAELVPVVWVDCWNMAALAIQCSTQPEGRDNEWLHATKFLERPETDRAVDDRRSTAGADDHQRSLRADAELLIDAKAVVVADPSQEKH